MLFNITSYSILNWIYKMYYIIFDSKETIHFQIYLRLLKRKSVLLTVVSEDFLSKTSWLTWDNADRLLWHDCKHERWRCQCWLHAERWRIVYRIDREDERLKLEVRRDRRAERDEDRRRREIWIVMQD